ncbi:glycosyltransferase [Alcanivorax sp. DP30]|uniref:glycosyltransferase n=1 Tax=Alcanivorax sp. DP30 TaxID=2606217 RepID=UPI001368CE0C|nr:glycosyltransferase [Alcanivorax sp. DP30]MZR62435.1 glycosyltransferase [Alcanivorax sp. DP30]
MNYKTKKANNKPKLLVLASTYPRWENDHEPNFVHKLNQQLSDHYDITVVTSIAPGAKPEETLDSIKIKRFRYAPRHLETLVYGGGILTNLRQHKWKWVLVLPFLVAMAIRTRKEIKKQAPIAIHCHWIIPQGLVLWLLSLFLKLPPVLITSHGADLFSLKGSAGTWIKRKTLQIADAISVVSTPMKLAASELGAHENATYIAPMGFEFPEPKKGTLPKRTPSEVLFVGRLVEKKGLKYLIEAIPQILEKVPDFTLRVIGDGPERSALEALADNLSVAEKINFMGALPQTELPSYYQTASLFCAPFIEAENGDVEGLGLVTLEAMSFKCPVLIGDVPAIADVIPAEHRQTCIASPKNRNEIATKIIRKLARNTSEEEITNLKAHAMDNFSWDASRNTYLKILASLEKHNNKP